MSSGLVPVVSDNRELAKWPFEETQVTTKQFTQLVDAVARWKGVNEFSPN